ncbi:MAG: hypothetical protein KUG56_04400, partial [Kordiimonadaceae bacterium]|nr:hypothetical protein [Kordiimonadaceae bacterium]
MVRVSSFAQQQVLIRSIMDNQQDVFTAQRQIATGKRIEDYKELAGQAGTLLGSRSFQARVETYQDSIKTIDGKLQANDVQVGGVIDAMDKLKDTIQVTLANAQAEGFGDFLEQTFKFTAGALNTNIDGTYLFSGAETSTKPVNVDNLTSLSALASTSDAFDNSSVAFQAKIADGVDMQFGVLASDVGLDIFSEMVAIHDYTVANGAIDGALTDAERAFLEARLATLDTAIDKVRQVQVSNGLNSERLEVVDNQHKDTTVFL